MRLSQMQIVNRAAHRARLEFAAARAASACRDVDKLLERRQCHRAFLDSKHQAITQLEDEAFAQVIEIVHIQRRLYELGYAGD
jgi:hypothetical protein